MQRAVLARFVQAIQARVPPTLRPMQRVARFYFVVGLGAAAIGFIAISVMTPIFKLVNSVK